MRLALSCACALFAALLGGCVATTGSTVSTAGAGAGIVEGVLDSINEARRDGHDCASGHYPATEPLTIDARLTEAAQQHAEDLADRRTLSHRGADGSDPFERMEAAGYRFANAAENVAEGQQTPRAVVDAWLASRTGHCDNVMDSVYRHMGVGMAQVERDGRVVRYWVLKVGREL